MCRWFFAFWLRLGQWICTAHANHEVNHFPDDKVRFQEASLSGELVSICHSHTKADAPHCQPCTDEWFWDSVSFWVVLNLMNKCQQSTLNAVSRHLSWNKSWVFSPGCNCDIGFCGCYICSVSASYQPLSTKIPWQPLVRTSWMDVGVGTSSVGVNWPGFRINPLLNGDGIEERYSCLTLGLHMTFFW